MLAVVQHDQHILRCQRIQQRLRGRSARLFGQPQRLRDGRRHRVLVGDRGQLRQPHAVPRPAQQPGGQLQAQPGLAAPARPGQRDQTAGLRQNPDLAQLPVTADKPRHLGRQIMLPARRPRRRARPGGQHLPGRDAAAGRRDEQLPPPPGQAQRTGQQHRAVFAGGPADAPLQVTDRPRGQPRRLRQLLLRQPRLAPQPPQQADETQRRLLRHRPIAPPPSPTRRPPATVGHGADTMPASLQTTPAPVTTPRCPPAGR